MLIVNRLKITNRITFLFAKVIKKRPDITYGDVLCVKNLSIGYLYKASANGAMASGISGKVILKK